MNPNFAPSNNPAIVVKKNCSVNGTIGTGIFKNAPIEINAENIAQRIIFLIRECVRMCNLLRFAPLVILCYFLRIVCVKIYIVK